MKSKILKRGDDFIITLPPDWANRMMTNYGEIEILPTDEQAVLRPPSKMMPDVYSYEVIRDRPYELELSVFAAYMRGYDGMSVRIPIECIASRKKLMELTGELYGLTVETNSARDYTILFSDVIETRIPAILTRTYRLLYEMNKLNSRSLEDFPDNTKLEHLRASVYSLENESDMLSFYLKRLVNKSLRLPELFLELGLRDTRDLIHFHTIMGNAERAADLEKEEAGILFSLAEGVQKSASKLDINFVRPYKTKCFSLITKAFKSLQDPVAALELIEAEKAFDEETQLEYLRHVVPLEARLSVVNNIEKVPQRYRRMLYSLEGKIWANTGVATNIAEAAMNMNVEHKPRTLGDKSPLSKEEQPNEKLPKKTDNSVTDLLYFFDT